MTTRLRHAGAVSPELRTLVRASGNTLTAAAAVGIGVSARELRHLVRSGELVRVGHGAYVDGPALRNASPAQAHVLRARAILSNAPPGVALSHHSAALLWGLPLVGKPPDHVHLMRIGKGSRRATSRYTIHGRAPGARFTSQDGLRVVEPSYAWCGVARTMGLEQAVVAGDGALHHDLMTLPRAEQAVRSASGAPGHGVAAAALSLLDGRSESAGESRCRLLLHHLGYDLELQVKVVARDPYFAARVDFRLRGEMVVIEFDGLVKYGKAGQQGDRSALVAEKKREDRLRALGYEVVRLTWTDLAHPERVRALIEDARARVADRS